MNKKTWKDLYSESAADPYRSIECEDCGSKLCGDGGTVMILCTECFYKRGAINNGTVCPSCCKDMNQHKLIESEAIEKNGYPDGCTCVDCGEFFDPNKIL